uniref:Uncharacterized protein n=1 Tax=Anguilla anguilla TaxID=7936 RepID=A0A0E9WD90_ANGAN
MIISGLTVVHSTKMQTVQLLCLVRMHGWTHTAIRTAGLSVRLMLCSFKTSFN